MRMTSNNEKTDDSSNNPAEAQFNREVTAHLNEEIDNDNGASSTKSEQLKLPDFYVNLNTGENSIVEPQLNQNNELIANAYIGEHVEDHATTSNDENYVSLRMSPTSEYQLTNGMNTHEFVSSSLSSHTEMRSEFVIDYNVPVFGAQVEVGPLQKTISFQSTFLANQTASNNDQDVDRNECGDGLDANSNKCDHNEEMECDEDNEYHNQEKISQNESDVEVSGDVFLTFNTEKIRNFLK